MHETSIQSGNPAPTIHPELAMLNHHDAVATLAVRNITIARHFYESTLGLTVSAADGDDVLAFRSGQSTIFVYRSEYAGTNEATALTWPVGDKVDVMVRALKAKGVHFEHYELPQTHIEGDVHVAGERRIAWFKDPDGNIHSLVSN
jgi:catechol 2,3-dioxygenase-like lactoylglutathione lyase family enzyme